MRSEQMSKLTIVESLASFAVVPVIRKYVVKGDKKVMAIRFLMASVAPSAARAHCDGYRIGRAMRRQT
jgi:hypothetical protein